MKSLILVGCGGHAKSVIELIESTGNWKIHGLIGLQHEVGRKVLGYTVMGTDSDLSNIKKECESALLGLGQITSPSFRKKLGIELKEKGFHLPVLISPKAVVSRHAQLGEGTTIGHGAVINAGAVVGANCIINTNALIEHDVQVEDYCHISTGALVNGGAHIGSGSFVGSGAIIREGLKISENSIIGAGKCVMGWPLQNK